MRNRWLPACEDTLWAPAVIRQQSVHRSSSVSATVIHLAERIASLGKHLLTRIRDYLRALSDIESCWADVAQGELVEPCWSLLNESRERQSFDSAAIPSLCLTLVFKIQNAGYGAWCA